MRAPGGGVVREAARMQVKKRVMRGKKYIVKVEKLYM